jgi:pimeloyl-ACP methyl ester carboxylesterase
MRRFGAPERRQGGTVTLTFARTAARGVSPSRDIRSVVRAIVALTVVLAIVDGGAARAADRCNSGTFALSDAKAIAGVRGAINAQCPCAAFDASSGDKTHSRYVKCAKTIINDAADGTPLLDVFALRRECKREVIKIYRGAACGYAAAKPRVMCCEAKPANGKRKAKAKLVTRCVDSGGGQVIRHACYASPFAPDACSFDATNSCTTLVVQETVNVPSGAQPANTPGSPGVTVTNPKLLTQFGGGGFSLNNARYTRHHLAGPPQQPDAILVLVPGFEGGAGDFAILAESSILRAQAAGFVLEIWAFDRRSNQLEDGVGLDLAEDYASPEIALDWLYGGELGLTLHPVLAGGPNRRAVFYNVQDDVPFIANWTNLVFSRDIDAVVTAARAAARNQNVFLGGHSAGTGFTARYASTDFNPTGVGPADPGYAKLRGLVLLEGTGGSTGGAPLAADTLDRIEAKFDGGLFGAVRDNAPRCVDGVTPCTIATEGSACGAFLNTKCTPPTGAYSIVTGILNPRILSAGELSGIQSILDPEGGENIIRVDQGAAGNNAVEKVPDLASLAALPRSTARAGLGGFVDDDGLVAALASFVATSVGAPGPMVNGLVTWQDIYHGPFDPTIVPNNGPPPVALTLPLPKWGQEKEVTSIDRFAASFYKGGTNFTDIYYPNSGLSVTSVAGVCTAGTCSVGNVGASCTVDANCSQAVNLDSTALSIGRGRRDIENLTQAANVNIPVIAFGGTNGLATVPGAYTAFGTSIGVCTAPSCDGTPRVVDASTPNPAFPTFGGVPGGYEVVMAEGFAHLDVVAAEDNADNPIPAALVAFLQRNLQ